MIWQSPVTPAATGTSPWDGRRLGVCRDAQRRCSGAETPSPEPNPPPGSRVPAAVYTRFPWRVPPGRKRWELSSCRRQQTRGIGNTYCDSSKIRYTSHPAKSHTYQPAGSRARLLTDTGSETSFLSAGWMLRGSGTCSGGCGTEESSSANKAGPAPQHLTRRSPLENPDHRTGRLHSLFPAKPKHPGVRGSAAGSFLPVQASAGLNPPIAALCTFKRPGAQAQQAPTDGFLCITHTGDYNKHRPCSSLFPTFAK